MNNLQLQNIRIQYQHTTVIEDLSLTLHDGQIGCFLGPSGCGKTTLLRAIAGFEPVLQGRIVLNEQVISAAGLHVPPEQRNIGMVFQDYALFPHLNIADNIAFGIRHWSAREKHKRVIELLDLINLPAYQNRYPHELSGGQQQRIALARALAPRPRLLLLDEPFASQDVELREMLAKEVREILKREGMTAMLVTHDQQEAFAMADGIGVIQSGRLQQWGSGYELYHQPVNQFVAGFIGQGALLAGRVLADGTVATALGVITGDIPLSCEPGCFVDVLIRPDDVRLLSGGAMRARIRSRVFRGAEYLYTLVLSDASEILVLAPSHQVFEPGSEVSFELDMQHLVILPQSIDRLV